MSQRLNYNTIAHRYDAHADRRKKVDAGLFDFIQDRPDPCILDIGCGTGTQLAVNHVECPTMTYVGLDFHIGMLHQAQRKTREITWIHGSGEDLPFADNTFDYITNQFSFHHIQDKPQMLAEIFRVLKPGGRFAMSNICPQEMAQWYVYRYFPTAYRFDLEDFMPHQYIRDHLNHLGFCPAHQNLAHHRMPISRDEIFQSVDHLDPSQCHIIPSTDYQKGMQILEQEIAEHGKESTIIHEICLLNLTADKPTQ